MVDIAIKRVFGVLQKPTKKLIQLRNICGWNKNLSSSDRSFPLVMLLAYVRNRERTPLFFITEVRPFESLPVLTRCVLVLVKSKKNCNDDCKHFVYLHGVNEPLNLLDVFHFRELRIFPEGKELKGKCTFKLNYRFYTIVAIRLFICLSMEIDVILREVQWACMIDRKKNPSLK